MRHRSGLTLVELLIVTMVIGILAGFAAVQLLDARQKAYLAAVQADFHELAVNQEIHFHTHKEYASLSQLEEARAPVFSPGVEMSVTHSGATGWAATAVHTGLPNTSCGMFMGVVPLGTAGPATTAGVVVCQ